jgi:hypothetical protein
MSTTVRHFTTGTLFTLTSTPESTPGDSVQNAVTERLLSYDRRRAQISASGAGQ